MRKAHANDVAVLPPGSVAPLIQAGGFERPAPFSRIRSIHAWLSQRARPARSPRNAAKAVRPITLLGLVGALASGPAPAQEPQTAITEARTAAVSFALTMDLVTASLASTCAKADEVLSVAAPAARSAWTEHNGPLVESAHDYLLFLRAVVASEQGEDAGQAFYEEQKARLTADAHTALTETFPGGVIDANACPEVIANLGSGGMNLEAKPEFHQALVEIQDAISRLRQGPR